MYAIIRTGGKQYKVQAGDKVKVEKVDHKLGDEFDVTDVLLVGGETTHIGQPIVKNAKVTVVVTKQTKDRKVLIFKKKRRQGYRRLKTHRQPYSELFIKAITSPDGKVTKAETTANVVDVDAKRQDRIQSKIQARIERTGPNATQNTAEEKVTTKSASGKKVAAKKKVAKKASAKKPAKKKAAKKVAAKTTKKASK